MDDQKLLNDAEKAIQWIEEYFDEEKISAMSNALEKMASNDSDKTLGDKDENT